MMLIMIIISITAPVAYCNVEKPQCIKIVIAIVKEQSSLTLQT